MAAADSQYKTGFAYTTNWLSTPMTQLSQESKWKPLVRALFQCIYDHEGTQVETNVGHHGRTRERKAKCQST